MFLLLPTRFPKDSAWVFCMPSNSGGNYWVIRIIKLHCRDTVQQGVPKTIMLLWGSIIFFSDLGVTAPSRPRNHRIMFAS